MPSSINSVTINRAPDAVFAFIADGATAPQWRSGVTDVALVSGSGIGARYRRGCAGQAADALTRTMRSRRLSPAAGWRLPQLLVPSGQPASTGWLQSPRGRA